MKYSRLFCSFTKPLTSYVWRSRRFLMTPVFFRLVSLCVSIDCFCCSVVWSPFWFLSLFTARAVWTNVVFSCCLYNSHNFLSDHFCLVTVFLLSLSKGELRVSSVGSLWTQQKSRCRPFLHCTGVSYTVWRQPINKWVCVASTRAPHQHWWPTSQRTLCSSWATASVSRSSA